MWPSGSWGVFYLLRVSSARSNDPIHGMKCEPQNTYDVISYASTYGEQSRLASIFAKNPQRRSQNPETRFRRSTKFRETKSKCYAQTVRVDPKKLIYVFVVLSTSQIYKYLPSTFLPFGHTTPRGEIDGATPPAPDRRDGTRDHRRDAVGCPSRPRGGHSRRKKSSTK